VASGYSESEATWKTERQVRYLWNKIERAVAESQATRQSVQFVPWSDLRGNPRFEELYEQCLTAFAMDARFRQDCLAASDWVLQGRLREGHALTEQGRRHAVAYLLAELPLFLDSAGVFGYDRSVFVYHRAFPLFERLFGGFYSIRPNDGQHFVLAEQIEEPLAWTG
jgi:cyclo(L-tyrosyl-L-tyrosyl) synthase